MFLSRPNNLINGKNDHSQTDAVATQAVEPIPPLLCLELGGSGSARYTSNEWARVMYGVDLEGTT